MHKKPTFLHESIIPPDCQSALDSLRVILPKLEAEMNVSVLVPMCDFYISALDGIFCPHAPHLFVLGKGARESK